MLESSGLLNCGYRFEILVNSKPVEKKGGLLRVTGQDTLDFTLELDDGALKNILPTGVVLHSDINGSEWDFIRFTEKNGSYRLSIGTLSCSRASFRFAVETSDRLLWEPDTYQGLLVDPGPMDIRLYTLIPNVTGKIGNWMSKLDRVASMGFNAVHLLPFTQMGSSESPYAASDLFSVDASYGGSMDEFKIFAAKAEKLGIKLCLDMVLNHVSTENRICLEHAQWLTADSSRPDGMKRAGCYHHDSWVSWEDLVLLNYDHPDPEIRKSLYQYMLEYVLYWMDATGGNNIILRLDNLHSSNRRFVKWLLPEIRKKYPDVIILSEYFGAEHHLDEAVVEYGLNLLTANSWEYPFAPVLERYLKTIAASTTLKYLIMPTSHDTQAAAQLFGRPESSIPRYAVCALMGTGITGIVQGYEYGMPEKTNFIGRDPDPLPDTGHDFTGFIRQVNQLLKTEPCLSRAENIEFIDTGNNSIIACFRRHNGGGGILIAVNLDIFSGHSIQYRLTGKMEQLIGENAQPKCVEPDTPVTIKLGTCGVCVIRIRS